MAIFKKFTKNQVLQELIESAFLMVLIAGIVVGLVLISLLGISRETYNTYVTATTFIFTIGAFSLILFFALKIGSLISNYLGKPNYFYMWGFDPDKSIIARYKPLNWLYSIGNTTVVSITLFSLLSLYAVYSNIIFPVPQSIAGILSKFGNIFLRVEPYASMETLFVLGVMGILMGILLYITDKYKLSKTFFHSISLTIIPIMGALTGYLLHRVRYGNIDQALNSVIFFWGIGTFLTVLTGTFLVMYIWHFMINLYVALKDIGYTTNELTIITFVMLIALNISYWTIKVTIKRKNKLQATIGAT